MKVFYTNGDNLSKIRRGRLLLTGAVVVYVLAVGLLFGCYKFKTEQGYFWAEVIMIVLVVVYGVVRMTMRAKWRDIRIDAMTEVLVLNEQDEMFYIRIDQNEPVYVPENLEPGENHERMKLLGDAEAKEVFLKGKSLPKYLNLVWTGEIEPLEAIKVEPVRCPSMKRPNLMYYIMPNEWVRAMYIYKENSGYDEIIQWVERHKYTGGYKDREILM